MRGMIEALRDLCRQPLAVIVGETLATAAFALSAWLLLVVAGVLS